MTASGSEAAHPCAVTRPGMNLRKNPVGEITAKDGDQIYRADSQQF